MKIQNNIQFQRIYKRTPVTSIQKQNVEFKDSTRSYCKLPLTNVYLAFLGQSPEKITAYSQNLKATYAQLKDGEYPNLDIKQRIEAELKAKNPDNKKLCDIHFERYGRINNIYTLEELKDAYPEFEDVIPSSMALPIDEGSFLDRQLDINNKNRLFPNTPDLTLQLIKLYWGKGFSLTDLSEYVKEYSTDNKGYNFHYLMSDKLKIPLMNRRYAQVLKLSNKKYYEELKKEMSKKRERVKEEKRQRAEGEPVPIFDDMDEAETKDTSRRLKKTFESDPQRIYRQTKGQKRFYKRHPYYNWEMSTVVDYAWNHTDNGKEVAKRLEKYLRRVGGIKPKQLTLQEDLSSEQESTMATFWKFNNNAALYSKAMQQGFQYIRSPQGILRLQSYPHCRIAVNSIPAQLIRKIRKWYNENGGKVKKEEYLGVLLKTKNEGNPEKTYELKAYEEKVNELIGSYLDIYENETVNIGTSMELNLIKLYKDLKLSSESLPKSLRENKEEKNTLLRAVREIIYKDLKCSVVGSFRYYPSLFITNEETLQAYRSLLPTLIDLDCGADVADYLNKSLDEIYQLLQDGEKDSLNDILR